ncbi:MAG: peptide-methionine (R)-S-oxide reductase MsrB [Phenylobacterium sp.]|uniref:peptide-methionine (R)-S-oxide reductase MsrB n=1 Tax=Phenylobacterium sp. TaxID=1871053 RepID=UPI002724FC70|nr:peptide-methionine (R)-S-oxide reductase MsrB [Phenylobacterium sp.]MDO8902177.1 peptide-methionine (R)-S-oxide reductase MsrB [Phenylobacterium sp.]
MNLLNALHRRSFLFGASALCACSGAPHAQATEAHANSPWRKLTDAEWKGRLSPAAYQVLRREGTERAGTSPLDRETRRGTYVCAGCELPLFKSVWKYDSRTGWPSFYRSVEGALGEKTDFKIGLPRTEYHCARCLGHQGHVFKDGPRPTGLRYCNNGVALKFVPA